jgi:hypothetical protein
MRLLFSCLFYLAPLLVLAEDPVAGISERKKTIIKLYDVTANDALSIDNQFGQVSVGLWDKNEIRVQITISASASSDERTQQFIDAITIEEKRSGNQIMVRTNFNQNIASNWSFNRWKNGGDRNYVKIDYTVTMPRANALTIRNKFGNTLVSDFHAPLTVYSRYGNVQANELTSRLTDIDVAYGNANINSIDQAKLELAYGKLDLNRANTLTLINKFGKMRIGDIGKLNANIDYADAEIGTLRESGKIDVSFSGGFRIEQLPATVNNLDIRSSYSSVALPVASGNDVDFDVTVSYGSFNHSSSPTFHFTSQPNDDSNSRGPKLTKQYVGKVGKGTGTKVRVVSKFGNVSFK